MSIPAPAATWCSYPFQYIADLEPEVDPTGTVVEMMPHARYAKASSSRLNPYGDGPFCHFRISWKLPLAGIYLIANGDGVPMYVGECVNLSARFNGGYGNISPRNCYVGGQSTNCRINSLVLATVRQAQRPVLWFMHTTTTTTERKRLQDQMIATLRPVWNRQLVR